MDNQPRHLDVVVAIKTVGIGSMLTWCAGSHSEVEHEVCEDADWAVDMYFDRAERDRLASDIRRYRAAARDGIQFARTWIEAFKYAWRCSEAVC